MDREGYNPLLEKPKGKCILWTGAGSRPTTKRTQLCGVIRRYDRYRGKTVTKTPARYFYEKKHGPLRDGLEIYHICGVSLCINVDHILAGTRSALYKLAYEAGRLKGPPGKPTCKRGHPLTGKNLYVWHNKDGGIRRICRECRNARGREALRKKHGWKPRQPREHPPMHDPKKKCRSGKHRFTKSNTLVYWNSTSKRWGRFCRECTNKRSRVKWRKEKGKGNTIVKYREEWEESYG